MQCSAADASSSVRRNHHQKKREGRGGRPHLNGRRRQWRRRKGAEARKSPTVIHSYRRRSFPKPGIGQVARQVAPPTNEPVGLRSKKKSSSFRRDDGGNFVLGGLPWEGGEGEREFALRVGSGLYIWKDPLFLTIGALAKKKAPF